MKRGRVMAAMLLAVSAAGLLIGTAVAARCNGVAVKDLRASVGVCQQDKKDGAGVRFFAARNGLSVIGSSAGARANASGSAARFTSASTLGGSKELHAWWHQDAKGKNIRKSIAVSLVTDEESSSKNIQAIAVEELNVDSRELTTGTDVEYRFHEGNIQEQGSIALTNHCSLTGCTPQLWLNDFDHDGVTDAKDNCPYVANPKQTDLDEDGIGSACDPDEYQPQ